MCKDGSAVPGGESPSMDWMTDTPSLGAATRDMSWFVGFHHFLFPHVRAISDFPFPGKLSLKDPIKPQAKSKDLSPLWVVYVEYPLPTEQNLGGTATGISDRMGGPHAFDSLTLYTTVDPATSSQTCPYCNRSHNGWHQLMNHLRFLYWMVLVCPICAGCGSNSWRTVKHISKPMPDIASQKVNPGEPLWQGTDNRLRGLTRAEETATTFELPTWTNPPDDVNQEDRGHLIDKTLTEMREQLKASGLPDRHLHGHLATRINLR